MSCKLKRACLRHAEHGAYVVLLAILLPIILGVLAIGFADYNLQNQLVLQLKAIADQSALIVANGFSNNIDGWNKAKGDFKESFRLADYRSFKFESLAFKQTEADQIPDNYAYTEPQPATAQQSAWGQDFPWNTMEIESGAERLKLKLERGLYGLKPGATADQENMIFYSLETGSDADLNGVFLNSPAYVLVNAVRITLEHTGAAPMFAGIFGLGALPKIKVSSIAVLDTPGPHMVAPFAVPLCQLTNPYGQALLQNAERPVALGEALWMNPKRIDGVTRSAYHNRPASKLVEYTAAASSGTGIFRTRVVDHESSSIRGVIGLPRFDDAELFSFSGLIDELELASRIRGLIFPYNLPVNKRISAVIGQEFVPLESYSDTNGLLDNDKVSEELRSIFFAESRDSICSLAPYDPETRTDGLQAGGFLLNSYQSAFSKFGGASGTPSLCHNRPKLRRFRHDLPDYPRGGNLSNAWKLQELIMGAVPEFPPIIAYPLGSLEKRNPGDDINPYDYMFNLSSAAAGSSLIQYPNTWVNPLCIDPAVSFEAINNPDKSCAVTLIAMVVAPERQNTDYCQVDSPNFSFVTRDSSPRVVGWVAIKLYGFNFTAYTSKIPTGDRPAIMVPHTIRDSADNRCSYHCDHSSAQVPNRLDYYPLMGDVSKEAEHCAKFGRDLGWGIPDIIEGELDGTPHPDFPEEWPLQVGIQGLSTNPDPLPSPYSTVGDKFPWQNVSKVCMPGYSASGNVIDIVSRDRDAQYGCAGFSAMLSCDARPFAVSPYRALKASTGATMSRGTFYGITEKELFCCSMEAARIARLVE